MGGLCGLVGDSDKSLLKLMCNAVPHRGTVADSYIDRGISLAVNAFESEAQIVRIGSITIAFQGEIYNSESIKRQLLRKGVKLSSPSDAELVLQGFIENHAKAFRNLRGSFACAIWNGSSDELTLARDHFGQSTLYYCPMNGRILFASEIKSLLCTREVPVFTNSELLATYLIHGYIPSPNTLFSRVMKVPAACTIRFRARKKPTNPEPYWRFTFSRDMVSENDAISRTYDSILETVNLGVLKHEEFAIMLSGGFDSSLLAVFARKCTKDQIESYTFVPPGQENYSARSIAEQLDLVHHQVTLHAKDSIRILSALPRIYEDLIADPFMSLPTYALLEAARKSKAIFAGDGADNIFWGLPMLYDRFKYLNMFRSVPNFLKRLLLNLTRNFETVYAFQRSLDNFLVASLSDVPYTCIRRIFTDHQVKRLLNLDRNTLNSHSQHERKHDHDGSAITLAGFYCHQIKTGPDRTANISRIGPISSSFSLKLFEPFLDIQVVELAARLPYSFRQPSRSQDKLVLRKMASDYRLFPSNFHPRKMGLSCPLDDWYMGELKEWVFQTLVDELPVFINKGYMKSLLNRKELVDRIYDKSSDYRTSSRDIFSLLMLALWLREYNPEVEVR